MSAVVPLATINAGFLRDADIIEARDRGDDMFFLEVFGQESVPRVRPYGLGPHTLKVVTVEINSTKDGDLQQLLTLVETAKGHLPHAVQHLKK